MRPQLVSGLVLIDPGHEDMMDGMPTWGRRMLGGATTSLLYALWAGGMLRRMTDRSAVRIAAGLTADPRARTSIVEAYRAHTRFAHLRAGQLELRGLARSVARVRRIHAEQTLHGLPTAVVSGEGGFPGPWRRRLTLLHAAIADGPGGRHVVVPGTGHAVHHDRPDVVAQIIAEVATRAGAQLPEPGPR